MLIDLQRATAELTASPDLCRAVLASPGMLEERYVLSDREKRQLLAMVNHPGMQGSCSLYRINRVVPLILNLPQTLDSFGTDLETVLAGYWQEHPWGYRYSFVECERFCQWLRDNPQRWGEAGEALQTVLTAEEAELCRHRREVEAQASAGEPEG
ncbi:MAG: hypothetical protein ACKO8I_10675 [Cyanobacteriota bacterium]